MTHPKTREVAEMHMVLIEKLKDLNYYNKFIRAIQKYEAVVSREETIREVLTILRENFKNPDFIWGPPNQVADWLEERLREGK